MRGSFIAAQIIDEMKREQYYKKKVQREKCKDKECSECKYQDICDDAEVNNEI